MEIKPENRKDKFLPALKMLVEKLESGHVEILTGPFGHYWKLKDGAQGPVFHYEHEMLFNLIQCHMLTSETMKLLNKDPK